MAKTTNFSKAELNHRISVSQTAINLWETLRSEEFKKTGRVIYQIELAKEKRKLRDDQKRLSLLNTEPQIVEESSIEYSLSAKRKEFTKLKITSSRDSAKYIRNFYHEDLIIYESVFILLLDRSNQTIGYAKISQGGVSSTVLDVKIIAKFVVDSLASAVILAHNHPTGNLYPSEADRRITDKVKEALTYFDSKLLDHIILSENGYYSFADEGLI